MFDTSDLYVKVTSKRLNEILTCSSIQIEMNVFNFSEFGELVVNVVLLGLFVDSRHEKDPTFDGTLRTGFAGIPAGINLKEEH